MKHALIAVMLFAMLGNCLAEEFISPPTIQEINAKVVLSASGTITGELNGLVKIKALALQETPEQKISTQKEELEINGKKIEAKTESDQYGNNYALFEINETGEFSYIIEATVTKKVMPIQLNDFFLNEEIKEQAKYLEATKNIESDSSEIRTITMNKFKSDSMLETIAEVTDWIHNYIRYDKSFYPQVFSAIETLKNKRGTCDEFAVLTAAILRARGIPTRVVVGPVFSAEEWNFHGWLEAFNPNTGWIPIDSTYGEAGIVDATHIKMGHFTDFMEAADIVFAPATAKVTIEPKVIEVTPVEMKQFSNFVSLKAENTEIFANQWQDINATIENRINSYAIVPIEIVLPIDFEVEAKSRTILLNPLEKRQISWKTMIARDLEKSQYLEGKFGIISMQQPIEKSLRVIPFSGRKTAQLQVSDMIAMVDENTLKIEFTIENRGSEKAETNVKLLANQKIIEEKNLDILAFEKKPVSFNATNDPNIEYSIKVDGPGLTYTATVIPQKEISKPTNTLPENGQEQGQNTGTNQEQNQQPQGTTNQRPFGTEPILIAIILASAIAIVLLLKELVFR